MKKSRYSVLQRLANGVPLGFLVDTPWLKRHGVSAKSVYAYRKAGWLERMARGVYRRSFVDQPMLVRWETLMLSLYQILGYRVHLGGQTGLGISGIEYSVLFGGRKTVWLYGDTLPGWVTRLPLNARLVIRSTSLFDNPELGLSGGKLCNGCTDILAWTLRISTPERAMIEALDEVPYRTTFDRIDEVFDMTDSFRPELLSELLQSCRKYRVRRLFCMFAERHKPIWWKEIDYGSLDLGCGVHRAVAHGHVHPKFKLIVPKKYAEPYDPWF